MKVTLNIVIVSSNFVGLMHRLYGVGQFKAIKMEMIVYIILIGIMVICYYFVNLALENVRLDQYKSALYNTQL